jgi:hypothetical protein
MRKGGTPRKSRWRRIREQADEDQHPGGGGYSY